MKPKLVIWSDFIAPSGFGNVAKNLFDDLHKQFEVSIIAINYFGNKKYDTSKYFIYPASQNDLFNKSNLIEVIKQEQPELIILFQDSFNIAEVLPAIKKESPKSKIIVYFPVDASDYSIAWINVLEKPDAVITYTNWAVDVIKTVFPKISKEIYKLYHGVNSESFFPIPYEEIVELRKVAKWTNKFVAVNVNRFQPRKAVPLSVRAFSLFAKGYKICKCGNWYPIHRNICDMNGCGPKDVTEVVNKPKEDVYYYLHMNAHEPSMGLSRTETLQNHLIVSGFIDKDYEKIIGINSRKIYSGNVPESVVNQIYNAGNINISTSNGEGFGLSLIESMATGTRSIAPNNSAIPEVLQGTGTLVNNIAVYSHQNDNAFMRPVVDTKDFVLALEKEYKIWKGYKIEKQIDFKCLSAVKTYYDWVKIREEFNNIIKTVLQ